MRKPISSIPAILPAVLPAVLGAQPVASDTDTTVELATAAARAIVSVEPYPRVVAFSLSDGESVLLDAEHRYAGVRTWFMEPTQVKHSGRPANRKARVVEQSQQRVLIEAEPDQTTQLQVLMDITLDAEQPRLIIKHGLRNLAEAPRTIAAWGIVSVRHEGRLELATEAPDFTGRQLVYLFNTRPNHPAFDYPPDRMTVDLRKMGDTAIKAGAATSTGQAVWIKGDQHLIVRSTREAGDYPEGGANATVYASGVGGQHHWAELESVGPLRRVGPGEVVWLKQRLKIRPDDSLLNEHTGGSDGPDSP